MNTHRTPPDRAPAYSLVEVIIAMSLLAIGMGVIANLTLTYTQGVQISDRKGQACSLAAGLMAEVLSRPHTGPAAPGGSGNRLGRASALQFAGWESPVCDFGEPLEPASYPVPPHVSPAACTAPEQVLSIDYRGYQRSVDIACVQAATLAPVTCESNPAALLKITVTVRYNGQWLWDMVAFKGAEPSESGS